MSAVLTQAPPAVSDPAYEPEACILRWKPTSFQEAAAAESKVLEYLTVPFEQRLVDAGGVRINTITLGSGPALVLLHGFAAAAGLWVKNLERFSRDYTVYAIDLPGFGRSGRPVVTDVTAEGAESYFVDRVEAWRSEIGLTDGFTLLGHSLGAFLASCYTMRYPQHVTHLILADPWGVAMKPSPEQQQQRTRRLPWALRPLLSILTLFNPLATIRAAGPWGPTLVSKVRRDIGMKFQDVCGEDAVMNYIYHSNAPAPASGEEAFVALQEGFGWARRPLAERLDKELSPEVGLTLLYGSHSWMDRQAGSELAAAVGEQSTRRSAPHYEIIPNAGHHIYVDNVEAFHQAIQDGAAAHRTATRFETPQN